MPSRSLRGVEALYLVFDLFKDELETNPFVNRVTAGTLTEVDLLKQTIFPLAHITLNNITHNENNLSFNFTLFNLDIADISKEPSEMLMGRYYDSSVELTDFFGNDNTMFILSNQLFVVNRFISRLRTSMIYDNSWQLEGNPQSDVINKELENMLVGYETTFSISVPNDIDKC